MPSPDQQESYQGLYLVNREQIEVAWQAAAITGLAPSVEPLLGSLLGIHLPQRLRTSNEEMTLYLGGESGEQAREEVVRSLKTTIESLGKESTTSKAARALLDLLQPQE